MGFISSLFGGKGSHGNPAETKRKTTKPENKLQKPNKLSKPRTNTSINNLRVLSTGGLSRSSSLADTNARGKRSSSLPTRTDGQAEDVGVETMLDRGRQGERDKRASRQSGLFRSKSSTPSMATELQDRPDNHWALGISGEAESLKSSDLLHRYSQPGTPNFAKELPTDNQLPTPDNPSNLHRSSSYIRSHQARLSLVPEAPRPAPTPDSQHLQRIANTEAILTGGETINSKNLNPFKRQSMALSASPALPVRVNSTESVHVEPESRPEYRIRRRSHLTPGIATRVEGVDQTARRSNVLRKPNPKARRQSATAPETKQIPDGKVERSKTLPSGEEIQHYYYDESTPRDGSSNSTQVPAPLQKPRFRDDSVDKQRMSTPTDLRHIGSFELGSLRITNGAAIPSATNTPRAKEKSAIVTKMSDVSPPTTPIADIGKTQGQSIKQEHSEQAKVLEIEADTAVPMTGPASRNTNTATNQSVYLDNLAVSGASPVHLESVPQVPGGADKLAELYRLDIDFLPNPFSPISTPSSPKLEPTSKHMAEQDALFEDETVSPLLLGSKNIEQPSHISKPMMAQKDDLSLPDTNNGPQLRPTQTARSSWSTGQGMLTMADSGYSSYASLGSANLSGSQSKPRDASTSVTPSGSPDSSMPTEPDASLISSKSNLPEADFWKTQHAPNVRDPIREPALATEATTLPPPLSMAQSNPVRNHVSTPPTPTAANKGDSLMPQAEDEIAKESGNAASIPPERPSRLQHRNATAMLQQSTQLHPDSMTPRSGAGPDASTTPVKKKKWQRNSTRSSFETTIAVQDVKKSESDRVQPATKRLSLTFKERAIKFSGLKQSTPKTDYVETAIEKPRQPPRSGEAQQSIRRKSSLTALSTANPATVIPCHTPESTTRQLEQVPSKTTGPKLAATTSDDKKHQALKTPERHSTASATRSLNATPYDAASSAMAALQNRASNQSSPAQNSTPGRPRRDRTGRIIGMNEESASSSTRARSQIRPQESERQEVLLASTMQSQISSQDGRGPAPMSSSSSANQPTTISQRITVENTSDSMPLTPSINVQDVKRQIPVKGKREKLGPPPTMLNDRNRMGVLGYWDASGKIADVDSQLEPTNRSRPNGSVRSALSRDASPMSSVKKVAFATSSSTANLPSMAPQWKGPSPKELAEMALAARKEGRMSADAQRRSMSANDVYDRRGGIVTGSRPSSVASESEGGRKWGWGFRGRAKVQA